MRVCEGKVLEDGADGVVDDAQGGLGPGEEGEEEGVAREEGDEVLEVGVEVGWAVGAVAEWLVPMRVW